MSFQEDVREVARKKFLFTVHALDQMNKPDRLISEKEVKSVVMSGEVIEEYPEDSRGPSCLMLGWGEQQRPLHVVCAPKEDYLAIVTAYVPSALEWEVDFKTRRSQ